MSRKYGMTNIEQARLWAASVKAERQGIVDAIHNGDVIPISWPAKATYLTATTYERGVVFPPDSEETGMAPTIVFEEGFEAWITAASGYAQRWGALYLALINTDLEGFREVKWFERFELGNAGYDRDKWKAGWVDVDALQSLIDGLPDMDSLLTQLDAILGADQLPAMDFRTRYLRTWDSPAGQQTTLEYDYTLTADIPPDPATRLPLTGGVGEHAWDACAVEVDAKGPAAEEIISQMTLVAGQDIEQAASACYRLFGHGSQTDARGE